MWGTGNWRAWTFREIHTYICRAVICLLQLWWSARRLGFACRYLTRRQWGQCLLLGSRCRSSQVCLASSDLVLGPRKLPSRPFPDMGHRLWHYEPSFFGSRLQLRLPRFTARFLRAWHRLQFQLCDFQRLWLRGLPKLWLCNHSIWLSTNSMALAWFCNQGFGF